jgi:MFS family permease
MLFASYNVVSAYTFYTLQDYIGAGNVPGGDVAAAVTTLLTVSIVVWVIVAGLACWLADRVDRRKMFVGVSALGVAASMAIPLVMPTWTGMLIYGARLGASIGTYFAIDLAVMSLVLPNADAEGRDLGILQVATGLPQLAAGPVAGALITWFGGYPALFVFGSLCALASGLLMFRIHGLR